MLVKWSSPNCFKTLSKLSMQQLPFLLAERAKENIRVEIVLTG